MIRMPEEKQIPLEDIRLGPLRHEQLPAELEPMSRWAFRHIGYLVHPTYEQWELGFLRDLHPEQEISLWVAMTWGVLEFLERHPDTDKSMLVGAVVTLSLGSEPKDLNKSEADELAILVRSMPSELLDPENPIFKT
jgi:hypothetical protein